MQNQYTSHKKALTIGLYANHANIDDSIGSAYWEKEPNDTEVPSQPRFSEIPKPEAWAEDWLDTDETRKLTLDCIGLMDDDAGRIMNDELHLAKPPFLSIN